ncbi:MAG TPA: Xaa-Pro peptidase family protein [Chloroflexota bacterium]|nr:Xaa-Pro peptidase family protein [Chloroflexota bacterium]
MNPAISTRLPRFKDALAAAGLDGAIVGRPENVFYLSGVSTSQGRPCLAVVGPRRAAVVAPLGSAILAPDVALYGYGVPGGIVDRIVDVDQESADALRAAFDHAELGGARAGIEDAAVPARHAAVLAQAATLVPLHEEVEALRRHKDAGELQLIREAIRCNEAGFAAAQRAIAPDVSEFEVYLAVARAIQEAAGMALGLNDSNHAFISGPRTEIAAGPPTDRRLQTGDLMIIDVNPVIRHYKGDITRTFCVGKPNAAQRAMHDVLVRALDRAMAAGRPGAMGREVDAVMRELLVEAGYGQWLTTHFGHGLGLQHLERPYIIPAEEQRLEEGMVIALEPGVYGPEGMSMRLEDNYLVTANGLEPLSHFPRELIVCG